MTWLEKITDHPLVLFSDFRKFFIGDMLVAVAERYFAITFAWWLVSKEGENGFWLGVLMSLEALPILFLSPFVGPLIDRYDKKKCMLFGVCMQTFFVSIICFLIFNGRLEFPYLCLLSFLMSCCIPVFEDAVSASVALLVDAKHLPGATAIQSSTIEFSNIFAAVISTSVIAATSVEIAVAVNVGLYVIGILFLLCIKSNLSVTAKAAVEDGSEKDSEGEEIEGNYFAELKAGFAYISGNKAMLWYALVYALETFFIVPIFILIPMLVKNVLHQTVNWVAVFETSLSIGAVLMAVFLSFRERYRNFYETYAGGLLFVGLFMIGMGVVRDGRIMAGMIFFIGALFAMLMALSFTMFQEVVPGNLKGRFFGVISTIAAGMSPLSYMTVGIFSDWFSTTTVLIFNGTGAILLSIVLLRIPRLLQHIGVDDAAGLVGVVGVNNVDAPKGTAGKNGEEKQEGL
ncbi:MAG: MFS transporter [Candidatus Ozemobacteraceae bacterium]